MTKQHNHAAEAQNQRLIAQVTRYYNEARADLEFYKEVNSTELQKLLESHLQHWKNELRSLILNTDERNA